jgi:hypothetical protein
MPATLAPFVIALALAAAAPATARTRPAPDSHAAGGDVIVLTYPSLVKSRVTAARRAFKHAEDMFDDERPAKAAAALKIARRRLSAAWRGARTVIRTTPPPPAEEASVPARAHASDDPVGPTRAAPPDTALLVLTLQHEFMTSTVELIDGATGTGLTALKATLAFTLDQRDQAIKDIRTIVPPAPPAEEARVRHQVPARASGGDGAVVSTFATVMPDVVAQLDDELQEIDGISGDSPDLGAGGRRALTAAGTRIARSRATVNRLWPPIPVED